MTENAGDDAGLSTASIENCDGHTSAVEEDESKKDSHLDGNPDDRYDENVLVTNADGMQASEEIDTKQCVMKEVTKPIEEAKELKVSETNLNHGFVEETLADEANVKEPIISSGNSEAAKRDLDVDVLARGIASVMGPVMNSFDAGVEGALKSQSVLASSIDRLMRVIGRCTPSSCCISCNQTCWNSEASCLSEFNYPHHSKAHGYDTEVACWLCIQSSE
ncbi:hypothetical protein KP509_27G033200 [Ceratopteris richardii]|uniref:Uncharacterized protein n=1 Tax=Ceratopteris richardii TaxID=49495 RepID=A0A8T2RH33_CERRI|nr:hypothetical protein KP509_27G033200 [Ceratopteris richardii]